MSATAPKRITSFADMEAAKRNIQIAAVPSDWTDEPTVFESMRRAMGMSIHELPGNARVILHSLVQQGLAEMRVTEKRQTQYRRVPNASVKPLTLGQQLAAQRLAQERAAADEIRHAQDEWKAEAGTRYKNPAREELERALGEIVPGLVEGVLRQHGLIE